MTRILKTLGIIVYSSETFQLKDTKGCFSCWNDVTWVSNIPAYAWKGVYPPPPPRPAAFCYSTKIIPKKTIPSTHGHPGIISNGIIIYIYIHTYMHACMHAYMHTCIHAYMHTCIHAYMHTCIHAYIHAYIHTYIHEWLRSTSQKVYIYIIYYILCRL